MTCRYISQCWQPCSGKTLCKLAERTEAYNHAYKVHIYPREILIQLLENDRRGEIRNLISLCRETGSLNDYAHNIRKEGDYYDG